MKSLLNSFRGDLTVHILMPISSIWTNCYFITNSPKKWSRLVMASQPPCKNDRKGDRITALPKERIIVRKYRSCNVMTYRCPRKVFKFPTVKVAVDIDLRSLRSPLLREGFMFSFHYLGVYSFKLRNLLAPRLYTGRWPLNDETERREAPISWSIDGDCLVSMSSCNKNCWVPKLGAHILFPFENQANVPDWSMNHLAGCNPFPFGLCPFDIRYIH